MADETSPEVQNGIIEMFVDATGAPESVVSTLVVLSCLRQLSHVYRD